jgi:hypothetical protein
VRSDTTEVIRAILRALGKRVEHLRRSSGKVWWIDAETWLAAYRINEMVVLCAQHLGDRRLDELKARLRALGIALSLVYGGPSRIRAAATTDLGAYLTKQRDPPPRHSQHEPWPRVPRSHPLRFSLRLLATARARRVRSRRTAAQQQPDDARRVVLGDGAVKASRDRACVWPRQRSR